MATATKYPYRDLDEIKRANARVGYFFQPEAMRFFNSRISGPVWGNRYFITSERDNGSYYDSHKREYVTYDHGRKYSVRKAMPDGEIVSVSEFQQFETRRQAVRYIEKMIERAARIAPK